MRRERVLVGLGAPAGAIGHDQMPRLDLRRVRHQLVVPREAIDVDLHDAQVGHRGGEMRIWRRFSKGLAKPVTLKAAT